MKTRRVWAAVAAAAAMAGGASQPAAAAPAAEQACKLNQIGELPLKFENNRPLLQAEINGRKVWMLADTGAAYTTLFRGPAIDMGLRPVHVDGLTFYGVGGASEAQQVTVRQLKLGHYAGSNLTLFVVGERRSEEPDVIGALGLNMLAKVDVEFDLAGGVLRLLQPIGCRKADLAYWAKDYMVAELRRRDSDLTAPFLVQTVLNGRRIAALLDSGSSVSFVTPQVAAMVGVRPDRASEKDAVTGIGAHTVPTSVATFDKLEIGDETISHVRLRVADLYRAGGEPKVGSHINSMPVEMAGAILGADFLRAHRVLISSSQNRMYFTYNGGPIFQVVGSVKPPQAKAEPADSQPAASKPPT